eukprot:6110721-Pleurochrysis_carterae.AAC.1
MSSSSSMRGVAGVLSAVRTRGLFPRAELHERRRLSPSARGVPPRRRRGACACRARCVRGRVCPLPPPFKSLLAGSIRALGLLGLRQSSWLCPLTRLAG